MATVEHVPKAKRSARRSLNRYLNRLEMKLGRNRLISFPYEICIDVTNKCNLHCPYCPTGRGEQGGRGRGSISYETFCHILDELGPYAYNLELFNWGEPFFNKELPRLITYAGTKGVQTVISSNLSFPMTDDYARSIIEAGLGCLTGAIDGADQASYEIYRRGGNFEMALNNLRRFARLKREMGSEYPNLTWQYLAFAQNEGRIEEARVLAEEIGDVGFSLIGGLYEDPEWAPKGDYSFPYLKMHPNRCVWLWNKAVFHWDGGFASCCMGFNKHDDFADFRPGAFRRLWNNDKFVAARRIWTEPKSVLPEGHFCTNCDKVRYYRGLPLASRMKTAREAEAQRAVG